MARRDLGRLPRVGERPTFFSGRKILATGDVGQMASRAAEIEGHDLYLLRERVELNTVRTRSWVSAARSPGAALGRAA